MSKAEIVRKSFNGGEIAPELHYRSDLEAYHNSCKSLENMTVTPWGAATRRPPTELLAKIDTATYGLPVKYVPFRFSLDETFHIIFTDGSGSAGTDAATADFIVFDAAGNLQTLEGASAQILTTIYNPSDLGALHYVQVNDFIYMTCGGDYPVQTLSRFFDEVEGANRWKIERFELKPPPIGNANTTIGNFFSLGKEGWVNDKTYGINDVVLDANIGISITSVDLKFYVSNFRPEHDKTFSVYRFRLTLSSNISWVAGDVVSVSGISVESIWPGYGSYDWTWDEDFGPFVKVGDTINGNYNIVTVESPNVIVINLFIYNTLYDGSIAFNVANATASLGSVTSGFYRSKAASNLNNALTNTTWWEPLQLYQGEIDVQSNSDTFNATDVGRIIAIEVDNKENVKGSWWNNEKSDPINAQGSVVLKTEGGAWGGVLELQVSKDGGGRWDTIGSIISIEGSSNGSIERHIDGIGSIVRVVLSEWKAPTANYQLKQCVWTLKFNNTVKHYSRIVEYIDSRNVKAETLSPLFKNILDYRWQLGEFSETTGYPSTLTIHDERMVFGGTKAKPNTVWASRVNDWSNFLEGDTEVSPYTFTIKSDSFDTIHWLRSTRSLMVGTENSESTMGSRDSNAATSVTNIDVKTHTYFGSANIQAVVTADLVFFVQGQKRRVRSTQYDFGTDQYLSSEMSILAHHITAPGIKEMSFRRHPYSSIFFVLDDGRAVSFTYERDNQVKGWARMELGGGAFIVSAASNYSEAGDIIGSIIRRGNEYTLETFGETGGNAVYLDGQTQSASGWATGKPLPYSDTSGLVVVMGDVLLTEGVDYSWAGSTLTIPGHTDELVTVGWPFSFNIEPTDIIELGDHGAQKRISKLGLYLLDSGGCDIAINGEDCPFQEGDSLGAGNRLDGEYQISVGGGTESAIRVKLSGSHHKPFNLSAFGVYGKPSQ